MVRFILFVAAFAFFNTAACGFDLQGHRGARGIMPENTLPGFAKALSIGVSTLELDAVITRDGVVVVSHNPAIKPDMGRWPNGEWLTTQPVINNLTFEELQKFDVGRLKPGSRLAARFPDQQPVDGTPIPSLAEVFELVKKSGAENMRFNIETKINPLDLSTPEQKSTTRRSKNTPLGLLVGLSPDPHGAVPSTAT